MKKSLGVALMVITYISTGNGQDACTWSPSVSAETHSTGSDARYTVNSTTALRNSIYYTWIYDSKSVAQARYSSSSDSFSLRIVGSKVEASIRKLAEDSILLTAVVKAVEASDDGRLLQVTRNFCLHDSVGLRVVLTVKDCNTSQYGQDASADTTPDSCGFGCKVNFTCSRLQCGTFTGYCQDDATFDPPVAQCSKTCGMLNKSHMRFADDATFISCGETKEVVCNSGLRMCGSTNGTCNRSDGYVVLEDESFTCGQECPVSDFSYVSHVPDVNPACGGIATFQCKSHLVCEAINFTKQCGQNGIWEDYDSPCSKTKCSRGVIESVCGTHCDIGNLTSLSCGEQLEYTCTSGAGNNAKFPVYCVAEDHLNYTSVDNSSICQMDDSVPPTAGGSSCTDCSEASQWAMGLGLSGLCLCIFLICRIVIQYLDEGCCCFCGGDCCRLKPDDKEKGLLSSLACIFDLVVMIMCCTKCCSDNPKTRIWIAFGVFTLALPIILLVISMVLLLTLKAAEAMIIGIVLGFVGIILLLAFIVSTFLVCTANWVKQQTEEGDKRESNDNDQPDERHGLNNTDPVA